LEAIHLGWYANQKERNEAYKAQKALEKKAALERGEPSTWDNIKSKAKESMDKAGAIADQQKAKKKEMDDQGIPYCPKCLSTSLSAQKKGGSIVKGLVGGAILGPVGLLAGGIGRNKIDMYCMKCGNKFKA